MKIISEVTGKEYKTVEECLAEEKKLFDAKKKEEEEKNKELAGARDKIQKIIDKKKSIDAEIKNLESQAESIDKQKAKALTRSKQASIELERERNDYLARLSVKPSEEDCDFISKNYEEFFNTGLFWLFD